MTPTQTGGRSGKETVGAGDEEESGLETRAQVCFFPILFYITNYFSTSAAL